MSDDDIIKPKDDEPTQKEESNVEEGLELPQDFPKIVANAIYRSPDEVYDFQSILGEGAFSAVVLGVHNETQRKYAIKVIEKEKVCDTQERQKRVLTEIGILKECDHPNILKVHEVYETAIDISLVLDLMEGGELFDLIVQETQFPEKHACRLVRQMLSALDYLHDKGICHRDLKPENMLCTTKDVTTTDVRITDFGLAKFGRDCLATPCGSVSYVAPEIVANEIYDNSVDIWALGCVLYFMLFGRPPFYVEGDDEEEIMDLVEEGIYSFPTDVPVSNTAKEFLSHLLEKDPGRRFNTKQALMHRWIRGGMEEDGDKNKTTQHLALPSLDEPVEKGVNLNLSKERRGNLKSSMNKAIDVQRDGVSLKPPSAASNSILSRRGVSLDFELEF